MLYSKLFGIFTLLLISTVQADLISEAYQRQGEATQIKGMTEDVQSVHYTHESETIAIYYNVYLPKKNAVWVWVTQTDRDAINSYESEYEEQRINADSWEDLADSSILEALDRFNEGEIALAQGLYYTAWVKYGLAITEYENAYDEYVAAYSCVLEAQTQLEYAYNILQTYPNP